MHVSSWRMEMEMIVERRSKMCWTQMLKVFTLHFLQLLFFSSSSPPTPFITFLPSPSSSSPSSTGRWPWLCPWLPLRHVHSPFSPSFSRSSSEGTTRKRYLQEGEEREVFKMRNREKHFLSINSLLIFYFHSLQMEKEGIGHFERRERETHSTLQLFFSPFPILSSSPLQIMVIIMTRLTSVSLEVKVTF